jgi:hypothetical protein
MRHVLTLACWQATVSVLLTWRFHMPTTQAVPSSSREEPTVRATLTVAPSSNTGNSRRSKEFLEELPAAYDLRSYHA